MHDIKTVPLAKRELWSVIRVINSILCENSDNLPRALGVTVVVTLIQMIHSLKWSVSVKCFIWMKNGTGFEAMSVISHMNRQCNTGYITSIYFNQEIINVLFFFIILVWLFNKIFIILMSCIKFKTYFVVKWQNWSISCFL